MDLEWLDLKDLQEPLLSRAPTSRSCDEAQILLAENTPCHLTHRLGRLRVGQIWHLHRKQRLESNDPIFSHLSLRRLGAKF